MKKAKRLWRFSKLRQVKYLNNIVEQDHRGIKGRYRSMRGFKAFGSADRFCRAFDEVRNFLRPTSYINQKLTRNEPVRASSRASG